MGPPADDGQLQLLLGALQGLSDKLALAGSYADAAAVAGAMQAIRALRTRVEPEPAPPLAAVP
jgi:hypothetical protein